jgi:hypothetical protein
VRWFDVQPWLSNPCNQHMWWDVTRFGEQFSQSLREYLNEKVPR